MTTVSHASLTGADLHEPKGAASAASGTILVANGLGSTSWQTSATLTGDVGELKAFMTPLVPSGFLECDGTAVSRSTYLNLFTAVTIQQTGSRNSGVATITGLSDTTGMKAGYYVGNASGITNGTTILSVDSSTQITMSANATSTGSGTVYVSPWPLGNGTTTFTLPNFTGTGRFPRSRTSSVSMGTYQSNQNLSHDHGGVTGDDGEINQNVNGQSVTHTHSYNTAATKSTNISWTGGGANLTTGVWSGNDTSATSGNTSVDHVHGITKAAHHHTITASGGSENRPEAVTVIWCVRY